MYSDEELLTAIQDGSTTAFDQLCECHREELARHIARIVREPATTEDLLQETFMRLWTHANQWGGRGTPRAWLFRIATNLALNHIRTQQRKPQQPLELPSDESEQHYEIPAWLIDTSTLGPEAALERAERRALINRLIEGLPAEKREVIQLMYGAEMDITAIAQQLQVPAGTIKSRLHYATRILARRWRTLYEEEE